MIIETTLLYSNHGSSDKFYRWSIVANPRGGFDVTGESWANGKRPQDQGRKAEGVDQATAKKIYKKCIASKVNGSSKYRVVEDTSGVGVVVQSERDGKAAGVPVQLLNAVSRSELESLFLHPRMFWTQKMNGWRNGIIVEGQSANGFNRKGGIVPLARTIADAAVATFPAGTKIDAELMDNKIYAFDAIAIGDRDLTELGYEERHAELIRASRGSDAVFVPETFSPEGSYLLDTDRPIVILPLVPSLYARAFFLHLQNANAEGIVGRDGDAPLSDGRKPGERIAVKYRNYESLTARVIRHNAVQSVGIAVYDGAREVDLGNVTTRQRPPIGSIVEVRYLPSRPGRKLDQPTLLMVRPPGDAGLESCTFDQLVYAGDQAV